MSQEQLLDNITHKDIKILTQRSASLGDDVSITRVFPSEFAQLQSDYPIFFKKNGQTGQFEAVALLGFNERENLYLTQSGWQAQYIPLSILRQPFLIGFVEKQLNGIPVSEPAVHIDMSHPRVSTQQGEALFSSQGGMSDYLQNVNSILLAIHSGHSQSESFVASLLKYELLESALINAGTARLSGLYTINEDVLSRLTDNAIVELHNQGYLQHIYMVLASLGQLRKLVRMKEQIEER
ncbi:SapC family protein [Pseudoalteromonas sp. JBTF-M23]|uniref:SapC family protein n=1 Tax=Pseudoalteromonas caenipelagi TaxID=2726988 RepID=A0A849V8I6_9GAMM|nr:SapC family protein [Pseudoalteromonas caenipelagi]NOU49175.1 SapC family protein [Pseudoalteromonas caenipelagi]